MKRTLLGDLTAKQFLCRFWQKKPLLVRAALPQYAELLDRNTLIELASREDLESRIVLREGRRWQVIHGPFAKRAFSRLPRNGWTLLVQGVNHALPAADRLLREFSFIPYARLDDLMVSYAPPGGGVGPHFDSYDVFLLQGGGERRWRISAQRDLTLVEDAPLKILRRFRPQREWLVKPGDLLYLPPRYAHEGVAATGCTTYSIGFRAPDARELGTRFLEFLQDNLAVGGMYEDPGLAPARHPAHIGGEMLDQMSRMLAAISWNRRDVAEFAGRYLTEPKAHVIFSRPQPPLSEQGFARAAHRHGVRLALESRMLFHGRRVFINGEGHAAPGKMLSALADRRHLDPGQEYDADGLGLLYLWYRAGYIKVDSPALGARP
jgi:50S ribosomal protein L16 3-hydroxylase